jgi:hypothetical protein
MFKIIANPTFTHPVKVQVPIDGGHREESFRATFRVVDADADERDLGSAAGSTAFLRDTVIGMEELVDADGKSVDYSDELRDQLLKLPFVRAALARTYFLAVSKVAAGN